MFESLSWIFLIYLDSKKIKLHIYCIPTYKIRWLTHDPAQTRQKQSLAAALGFISVHFEQHSGRLHYTQLLISCGLLIQFYGSDVWLWFISMTCFCRNTEAGFLQTFLFMFFTVCLKVSAVLSWFCWEF